MNAIAIGQDHTQRAGTRTGGGVARRNVHDLYIGYFALERQIVAPGLRDMHLPTFGDGVCRRPGSLRVVLQRARACFAGMTRQIEVHPLAQTRLTGASIVLFLAFALAPQTSSGLPAAAAGTAPVEQKVQVISSADIPDRADADEQFLQAVIRRSQLADLKGQRVE